MGRGAGVSARALKVVIGSLTVLVLAYAVVLLAGSRGEQASESELALAGALGGVRDGEIVVAEIVGPSDSVTLRREGVEWTANGFPADTLAVRRLREALTDGSLGALVSSNPSNHGRLGVGSDGAWTLTVSTVEGGEVALVVGNTGLGGAATYVRMAGSDDVFLLRSGLRAAVARSLGQWRDRTVVRVDTASVSRLAIEREGAWTEIVRAEDGWTVDGEAAELLPVRDLLGGLEGLIAVGFAPDSLSVDPVARRVVALDAAGDTLARIEMGEGDAGRIPARTPGVDGTLELSSFQADRITPNRVELTGG
jgi:hypothetical protein